MPYRRHWRVQYSFFGGMRKQVPINNRVVFMELNCKNEFIDTIKRKDDEFLNYIPNILLDEAIFYQTYTARWNSFTMRCKSAMLREFMGEKPSGSGEMVS